MGINSVQLNRKTDYALRALLFLAMQTGLSKIDEIAEKFSIAREHLTKITSQLAKLNYIIAIRGKGGGLKLNPKILDISLARIAKHFEPTFKVIDCEQPACPLNGVCRLNQALDKASGAFLTVLEQYTLRDILPQSNDEKMIFANRLGIKIVLDNNDRIN